jgi:hypothetical protein
MRKLIFCAKIKPQLDFYFSLQKRKLIDSICLSVCTSGTLLLLGEGLEGTRLEREGFYGFVFA